MSRHISWRAPDELAEALDAMADERDVDLSSMLRSVVTAALQVRQRTCKTTHRAGSRCGDCGLLVAERGQELERI